MAELTVRYQRIWFDIALPDGTYSGKQLRQAGLVVRQGKEQTYRLRWPGGTPEPPASELRVEGKPGDWRMRRGPITSAKDHDA